MPFHKNISATTYTRVIAETLQKPNGRRETGRDCDVDPAPFVLIIAAVPQNTGGTNSGARIRVTAGVGAGQVREFTLDDMARRYSGRAVNIEVEAELIATGQLIQVVGALAWDEKSDTEVSPQTVTNLIARQTLSANVATITSIGTLQREAQRLEVNADALASGTAIVPVQVQIFLRRYIDQAWVRKGGFVLSDTTPNSDVIEFPPGQFDAVGWRVYGFPASQGGSATMYVTEELGMEA